MRKNTRAIIYTIIGILTVFLNSTASFSAEPVNYNEELDKATPEYVEKIYQLALMEFDKQAYEESLKYIRHVIKSDMNHYKLRYLAAHDHWKLGHFDSATTHFQTILFIKPENPQAYMDLALMKIQERNYWAAESVLQTGMATLKAANVFIPSKFYNIYARIQLAKGFAEEALKYAQLAKSAFEKNGAGVKDKLEAMTLEARSHLLLENFDKAELAMQWAIAMRKDNVYAHNLLGYIYTRWAMKIAATEPKQAGFYKDMAIESFKTAKKVPGVVEEFSTIIDANLANANSIAVQ